MTNHVHLLLTPDQAPGVSSLMKHLGQRYVQRFNRAHRRTGTLWEGRFRSCLVDSEEYLLRCQRYIELNPVRAGMVRHPRDYPWSSYATNAEGKPSQIIAPHRVYLALGKTEDERLSSYHGLFNCVLPQDELAEIRGAVNSGRVLGSRAYVADVEQRLNRRVAHGSAGRPRKVRNRGGCSATR
jgi:putative transposase